MKMWIARQRDGDLMISRSKFKWLENLRAWESSDYETLIYNKFEDGESEDPFPEVTFENSPMYKVEWNKEHTWKILKFYKEGKINKIKFDGGWYKPVVNTNSYECDEFGNRYIACDGCDDCSLVDICHNSDADNPIGNACDEFGMSPCYMINTTPPNKHRKLSMWVRRHITKEEWDWLRQE